MSRSILRFGALTAVTATSLLVSAATFAADSTAGDSTPGSFTNCFYSGDHIAFQRNADNNDYTIPLAGVVTSYTISAPAGQTRGLRIGRLVSGTDNYVISNSVGNETVANGQTSIGGQVRLPVQAGDVLGQFVGANSTNCFRATGGNDRVVDSDGDTPVGSMTQTVHTVLPARIPVSVTIEPDADGDGYGDTTQDLCPTDASTHGACPQPAQPLPAQPAPTAKSFTVSVHHRAHHKIAVDTSGLAAGETYTITVGRFTVATGTATSAGSLNEQIKIPACLFPGNRLVRVIGSSDDRRGSDRINIGRPRAGRCS